MVVKWQNVKKFNAGHKKYNYPVASGVTFRTITVGELCVCIVLLLERRLYILITSHNLSVYDSTSQSQLRGKVKMR